MLPLQQTRRRACALSVNYTRAMRLEWRAIRDSDARWLSLLTPEEQHNEWSARRLRCEGTRGQALNRDCPRPQTPCSGSTALNGISEGLRAVQWGA